MKSDDIIEVLEDMGVDVHKLTGDEVNARCPVHSQYKGRESTRNSWYMNVDTGLWHCFTCGARGNLPYLVAQLTGDAQHVDTVQRYLASKGIERLRTEDYADDQLEPDADWAMYVSFEQLPPAVILRRDITAEVGKRFGIKWNPVDRTSVLPVISPTGVLLGWQEKKRDYVKNVPPGMKKGSTLFGIERASAPTAIVLESPFDVARFHTAYSGDEYSAVASFGADMSAKQIDLLADKFDRIVLALDNDHEGIRETNRLVGRGSRKHTASRQLPTFRKGIRFWNYEGLDAKDMGDMSDSEIIDGLSRLKVNP